MAKIEEHRLPPVAHPKRHDDGNEEDFPPPCIVEEEIPPADTTGMEGNEETPTRPAGDTRADSEGDTSKRKQGDEGDMDQPTCSALWHLPLVF